MKKLMSLVLAVAVLMLSLCCCAVDNKTTDEMFALDTIISFSIYDSDETLRLATIDKCKSEITRLENLLSATKVGSDVYNINSANGGSVKISAETEELLSRCIELSESVDGAFDVSVYPLVKIWGFDTKEYKVPSDEKIEQTLDFVGYENITLKDSTVTLKENMSIDLGAVAKGYIAQRLYGIMAESEIQRGLINLGGMVIVYDALVDDSFSIGVEYPDTGEVFAVFETNTAFTVTSGAYQRYFEENGERYHHIIDTALGRPSDSDISSVTIVTDDAVAGDALSTAFYVFGVEKTIEYVKVNTDENGEKFNFIILNSNKDTVYVSNDLVNSAFELQGAFKDEIAIEIIDI